VVLDHQAILKPILRRQSKWPLVTVLNVDSDFVVNNVGLTIVLRFLASEHRGRFDEKVPANQERKQKMSGSCSTTPARQHCKRGKPVVPHRGPKLHGDEI
jgi:hypothetical protein